MVYFLGVRGLTTSSYIVYKYTTSGHNVWICRLYNYYREYCSRKRSNFCINFVYYFYFIIVTLIFKFICAKGLHIIT